LPLGYRFQPSFLQFNYRSNDRVTVAVVGIRGQGGTHINSYCGMKDSKNVRLKTLCDADEQYFADKVKLSRPERGNSTTVWDIRRVLEDKEIDAVSCAIPNFWHALATIWACQAGKHVYIEKPATHNIFEGRKMVEAAKKYNVRVQNGLQNRSIPGVMEAIKFLHDGGIGDVFMAKEIVIKLVIPSDSKRR